MQKTNDVIGLGAALMDFLIEVDDNKLLEFDLRKGEMHLVDENKANAIMQQIRNEQLSIEICPGGSVANTLRGIGLLGGSVILVGKVGNDDHGKMYIEEMQKHGVSRNIKNHNAITGHAITFITPDSQRTFSTHLGAAIHISKEDIVQEDIAQSKILYIEGYQLEGANPIPIHMIEIAKQNGTLVALDLADPGVIRRNRQVLEQVLKSVDIVFVNELEAKEFTGKEEVEAASALGEICNIAIVKIGERGSVICHSGAISSVDAFEAVPVDTTGAGDTYAAGFLHGYCQGWELEKAAKLGSMMAAKIVELKGVRLDKIGVREILQQFQE